MRCVRPNRRDDRHAPQPQTPQIQPHPPSNHTDPFFERENRASRAMSGGPLASFRSTQTQKLKPAWQRVSRPGGMKGEVADVVPERPLTIPGRFLRSTVFLLLNVGHLVRTMCVLGTEYCVRRTYSSACTNRRRSVDGTPISAEGNPPHKLRRASPTKINWRMAMAGWSSNFGPLECGSFRPVEARTLPQGPASSLASGPDGHGPDPMRTWPQHGASEGSALCLYSSLLTLKSDQ